MRDLQTTDGYSYKGMFYGMKETEQGEMHLILSHASRNDEKDAIPYAIIPYNIFASLSAEEVDLAGQDISATPFSAVAGFEDTANAFDNAGYVATQHVVYAPSAVAGEREFESKDRASRMLVLQERT